MGVGVQSLQLSQAWRKLCVSHELLPFNKAVVLALGLQMWWHQMGL